MTIDEYYLINASRGCRELEEENASLQAEYERLKARQTPGSTPDEQHAVAEARALPLDQVQPLAALRCFIDSNCIVASWQRITERGVKTHITYFNIEKHKLLVRYNRYLA